MSVRNRALQVLLEEHRKSNSKRKEYNVEEPVLMWSESDDADADVTTSPFYDWTINISNAEKTVERSFMVHKCVLGIKSEYFKAIFEGNYKETKSDSSSLEVPTLVAEQFDVVLNAFYVQNFFELTTPEVCGTTVGVLLYASQYFQMRFLEQKCKNKISGMSGKTPIGNYIKAMKELNLDYIPEAIIGKSTIEDLMVLLESSASSDQDNSSSTNANNSSQLSSLEIKCIPRLYKLLKEKSSKYFENLNLPQRIGNALFQHSLSKNTDSKKKKEPVPYYHLHAAAYFEEDSDDY